jgi:hypothetical protein
VRPLRAETPVTDSRDTLRQYSPALQPLVETIFMAAPNDTQKSGEELRLQMDDLLAPLPETVRLGGRGPFVINLSTAGSPLEMPVRPAPGFPEAHMYRVQRIEDGRARYRLRFGPFATEDEADAVLKIVRKNYPSSLTATADAEDLRLIAVIHTKATAGAAPPLAVAPTASVAVAPPAALVPTAVASPAAPKPAAKPALASPAAAKPMPQKMPVLARSKTASPGAKPLGATTAAATDAVRALALLEPDADVNWRWFVIQLSVTAEPVDPATVPKLDIFDVYRLYSVAGIIDGRIVHALRVGFFAEQPAAAAVAGYLAAFYDKPAIKRVSAAERDRFAEKSLEPRKDMGATGKQAVIEITNERFVRTARGAQGAI